MNKERRTFIQVQISALEKTKDNCTDFLNTVRDTLESIKDNIEAAANDEQEYYDNMPESLQEGEKGYNAEQAASDLEEAKGNLETVIDTVAQLETDFQDIIDSLTNTIENY